MAISKPNKNQLWSLRRHAKLRWLKLIGRKPWK